MNRISILFLLAALWLGCSPRTDQLVGRWQVAVIDRGGDVIGGPAFNGTIFEFGEDGFVRTEGLDSVVVAYRKDGSKLIYQNGEATETYRIDSLSDEILVIFSDNDGIPTSTTMIRVE